MQWLSSQLRGSEDLQSFSDFLRRAWSPNVRKALLLCLPAAAIAIGLRFWLLYYMPGAFMHDDTVQILVTPERLIERGEYAIHGKRTFLTPLLYSTAALARIPLLYFAAIVQHFFGVLLVFVTGLLAMAWFSSWRLWIVPLTVLIAINPTLLWYEHAALSESLTVFGAVLAALAGTFFFRAPNRYTLLLFFLAVLFVAGARPEGRYFALFAVALTLYRFWGDWPRLAAFGGLSAAWALFIFAITRTAQSGILLYASMIQWSPAHLVLAPGLAERMEPFQRTAARSWQERRPQHTKLRKAMAPHIAAFLSEQNPSQRTHNLHVNAISKRAGAEIAVRNFWRLPHYAVTKFFIAHREPLARGFTEYPHKGQVDALFDKEQGKNSVKYSLMLWGVPLATREESLAFMQEDYDVSVGKVLTPFLNGFEQVGLSPIVKMELPGSPLRGLPWLYVCALLGAICLVLRERPAFGIHPIWFLFLCTLFIALMVTGNVRARYRIIFEPLWYIYLFALLDSIVANFRATAATNYFVRLKRSTLEKPTSS